MSNLDRPFGENKFFDLFWDIDGGFTDNVGAALYFFIGNIVSIMGGIALVLTQQQWLLYLIGLVVFLTAYNGVPFLGKRSPMYKINNVQYDEHGRKYDRHSYASSFALGSRVLLYKIMALPPEDRALFPHDLMATLSRDLLPKARYDINKGLQEMLNDIALRNEQRRIMEQKAIYHEGVVAAIESARENIQIETKTLKDYS